MKYLFGPVNSRRLGISLGVDLVPYKTCSLNCVYCECGDTTTLTSDDRRIRSHRRRHRGAGRVLRRRRPAWT